LVRIVFNINIQFRAIIRVLCIQLLNDDFIVALVDNDLALSSIFWSLEASPARSGIWVPRSGASPGLRIVNLEDELASAIFSIPEISAVDREGDRPLPFFRPGNAVNIEVTIMPFTAAYLI
jgi:hypothetical protein